MQLGATTAAIGSPDTAEMSQSAAAVESRDVSAARGGNERASRYQKCNPGGNAPTSRLQIRRIKCKAFSGYG